MADFSLFGQTITDVNGFALTDTDGADHTFIDSLVEIQLKFTLVSNGSGYDVTCNKTFADVYENMYSNALIIRDGSPYLGSICTNNANLVNYVAVQIGKPRFNVTIYSDDTCTYTTPPETVTTLTATANGTYTDSQQRLYSEVTVNVPGGGTNSWNKVAERTYQISNYTDTSGASLYTWDTGYSGIWTSNKILYIRIRDTEGLRAGYFYGTDAFYLNFTAKNGTASSGTATGLIMSIWSVNSNGEYTQRYGYNTTGYGIYPNMVYSNGKIRIAGRYNSTYSRTINGTYSVEVYLLDPPTGAPIFT